MNQNHVDAYVAVREKYERFVDILMSTANALLDAHDVDVVDITGRCKTVESFGEKISRKAYEDPLQQVTDLAAIRVVVLVESDIVHVETILRSAFNVSDEHSLDKSRELGEDRFGYRSLHLVADIGLQRAALPELAIFSGLKFEIQIRSALQHAWAEIEHDRNYKLQGELPAHLKRKFSQLAALLELADSQFDSLTREIHEYELSVHEKIESGTIAGGVDSVSLKSLLERHFSGLSDNGSDRLWGEVIDELRSLGVEDLRDFQQYLDPQAVEAVRAALPSAPVIGILRVLMMYKDLRKYLDLAWRKDKWSVVPDAVKAVLVDKFGDSEVNELFEESGINTRTEMGGARKSKRTPVKARPAKRSSA